MDAQVLESLKPPTNLEVLQIARYRGLLPPTWFTLRWLRNLKSLFLTNCRRLQVLPPLGQLSFLKHLHMKELCAVDHIGEEFYGADDVVLQSLRGLELDDLPKLAKWQEDLPKRYEQAWMEEGQKEAMHTEICTVGKEGTNVESTAQDERWKTGIIGELQLEGVSVMKKLIPNGE
ncbi:hypothetical protein E2562_018735 [Oryza meyeriana var. granulata]|uniref:R13L1/DRL21-like LRR repeat region domain-containing protein n=1 Tax=Oryza meyeriana var. granulata TaxID=110450 RepID=A0A6G1EMT3_9ORYZ|nr:hypothetical protein E2562_018735 [Oryza meyeriana var. granulata]